MSTERDVTSDLRYLIIVEARLNSELVAKCMFDPAVSQVQPPPNFPHRNGLAA